ncbi:helix-turn-helix domain-containing protein [Nostoc sp.]|uniref:helix-turn-helix domain-containing protein n=1 Tax=Nostoc sp. TaxID=1180 RepID=UPI002FFCF973
MSRPFEIEIAESEEELKKRLQTANVENQKEKLQMLWWVKSGQVKEQQEIGKRLAKDTSTVTRWLQKYRSGGLSELLKIKKAPGAKRKINECAMPTAVNYAALEEELKTGKGFIPDTARHFIFWISQIQRFFDKILIIDRFSGI